MENGRDPQQEGFKDRLPGFQFLFGDLGKI